MPTRRQQHAAARARGHAAYDLLLDQQGGHCALCPARPHSRRLDVDHDHHTGEVRGLLCHRCNRTLASWVSADWLRRAARYLEQPPAELPQLDG